MTVDGSWQHGPDTSSQQKTIGREMTRILEAMLCSVWSRVFLACYAIPAFLACMAIGTNEEACIVSPDHPCESTFISSVYDWAILIYAISHFIFPAMSLILQENRQFRYLVLPVLASNIVVSSLTAFRYVTNSPIIADGYVLLAGVTIIGVHLISCAISLGFLTLILFGSENSPQATRRTPDE